MNEICRLEAEDDLVVLPEYFMMKGDDSGFGPLCGGPLHDAFRGRVQQIFRPNRPPPSDMIPSNATDESNVAIDFMIRQRAAV